MKSSSSKKGGRKIGRNAAKPCQKRYVSEHRAERNAERRRVRHERRTAFFAARRRCLGCGWRQSEHGGALTAVRCAEFRGSGRPKAAVVVEQREEGGGAA